MPETGEKGINHEGTGNIPLQMSSVASRFWMVRVNSISEEQRARAPGFSEKRNFSFLFLVCRVRKLGKAIIPPRKGRGKNLHATRVRRPFRLPINPREQTFAQMPPEMGKITNNLIQYHNILSFAIQSKIKDHFQSQPRSRSCPSLDSPPALRGIKEEAAAVSGRAKEHLVGSRDAFSPNFSF